MAADATTFAAVVAVAGLAATAGVGIAAPVIASRRARSDRLATQRQDSYAACIALIAEAEVAKWWVDRAPNERRRRVAPLCYAVMRAELVAGSQVYPMLDDLLAWLTADDGCLADPESFSDEELGVIAEDLLQAMRTELQA
jgi:hypothetical protein